MYAQLGNIQFALLPVTELGEEISYDYAEHKVIEGKPVLQFVGDNLDELTIGLRFHFSFCDPQTEYDKLKAEADLHKALPFQFTNGKYLGRYVIYRISKTTQATADTGRILDLQLRVTLKEWFDSDPVAVRQAAQVAAAPGYGKATVPAAAALPGSPAAAAAAAANRTALVAGGISLSARIIGAAASTIGVVAGGLSKVMTAAGPAIAQIQNAADGIKAQVGPILQQAQAVAGGVQGAAGMVQGYVANISGYSSSITRVLSGLPGPAGKLGKQMASLNSSISTKATGITTLTSLVSGGSDEARTRAQIITRFLP